MAFLLVRIEDPASLPMNEFYDYNGFCYAVTRTRSKTDDICLDFSDFYEASIDTRSLEDIPVILVTGQDKNLVICGWYRKAVISAQAQYPAFFLEGNIKASSSEAVFLPEIFRSLDKEGAPALPVMVQKAADALNQTGWGPSGQLYEVIEEGDFRFLPLEEMLEKYRGTNALLRYPFTKITPDPAIRRNYDRCIEECGRLAAGIMNDECPDIRNVMLLEAYAKQASSMKRNNADGFYYLAMASYQLGFLRQGIKAIEKALSCEPDAADCHAQKAFLLVSMGHSKEAAALFHEAFDISGQEDYLLWEGKTRLLAGQIDQGYECFRRITDSSILERAGIKLKDVERKWPFVKIRSFKFRDLFHKG